MKYKYLLLLLLLILSGSSWAQEKDNAYIKDTLTFTNCRVTEIGNLELLAKRIYEAFLIYTTGYPQTATPHNLPISATDRNKYKDFNTHTNDIPIIVDATNEARGEVQPLYVDSSKMKTPIDKIKSIEVIYGAYATALYGTKGLPCVIKIKFKKN